MARSVRRAAIAVQASAAVRRNVNASRQPASACSRHFDGRHGASSGDAAYPHTTPGVVRSEPDRQFGSYRGPAGPRRRAARPAARHPGCPREGAAEPSSELPPDRRTWFVLGRASSIVNAADQPPPSRHGFDPVSARTSRAPRPAHRLPPPPRRRPTPSASRLRSPGGRTRPRGGRARSGPSGSRARRAPRTDAP
jgi:hypothetical protein